MRYRHLRRTIIAVLAAVAFLLLLAHGLQRVIESDVARAWLIQRIESRAVSSGIDMRVGDLRWEYLPPRMVLNDLSLVTAGVRADVEHLSADLLALRPTRRTVALGTVVADGVRIQLDAAAAKPPRRSEGRSRVRFTVHHLDLRRVDVQGRGLPGIENVGLHDLAVSWTSEADVPKGFLDIGRVHLAARGLEPVDLRVKTRFELDDTIRLPQWSVEGRGVALRGGGWLNAGGDLRHHLRGSVDLHELDRTVHAGGTLQGNVRLDATIDTTAKALVRARLRSPQVVAAGFEITDLRGRMDLVDSGLVGRVEHGRLAGGTLRGIYQLDRFAAPFSHHVDAVLDGANLEQIFDALHVPSAGLVARADIGAELSWNGGHIKQGHGLATAAFSNAANGLPVDGELLVELSPPGLLHFSASDLAVGSSVLHWQGPLIIGSWQPAWSVRADPAVVEELIPMVNAWVGTEALPPEVSGRGTLQVTLSGPWNRLNLGARLGATSLTYPPVVLDRVVAEATMRNGEELLLGPVHFGVGQGSGEVEGRVAWGGSDAGTELDLSVRGHQIRLSDTAAWIGIDDGVTGLASFAGGLRGTVDSPRGSWALGLADVQVAGQPVGQGSATVALEDGAFIVQGLAFDRGLSARVRWAVAPFELSGTVAWPEMPLDHFPPAITQLLAPSVNLDVDFLWPDQGPLTGAVTVSSEDLSITATAAQEAVSLDAQMHSAVSAAVHLDRHPDGTLEGTGEIRLSDAGRIVDRIRPDAEIPITGSGVADLDVRWPAGGWPRAVGRLVDLALDLDGNPVRLSEPADFTIDQNGLATPGLLLALLEDEMFMRGTLSADGALGGNLAGTLDMLLLRVLLPEWQTAGRASGVVEVLGSVREPRFEGIAEVRGASFRIPDTRTVISGINGTVLLSSGEAILEGVDFRFMHGAARCAGRLSVEEKVVQLSLNGHVTDLIFPLFSGFDPRVGGSWRLEGPVDDLRLSGDLDVTRAIVRRRDDLAAILLDWVEENATTTAGGGPTLDLRIEADNTIEARGPLLNLTGSAALNLTGTPDALGLTGKLEFTEGGDFSFQGVRYEVENGTITFSDPSQIDPFIDLQARALVQNYQITVRLTGTMDRLIPTVTSDPPLEEAGIYSLLALGHRNEAVGGGAIGVGLASTVLTRQINSAIDDRARLVLPVDQVLLDPFVESSTGSPAARVTLVKQLSPNWTVIVQSNLAKERQEVIVSRWYIAPGLFVEATRDIDGSLGIDLKVRRRY